MQRATFVARKKNAMQSERSAKRKQNIAANGARAERVRGMCYLWKASAMLAAVAAITARPCFFVSRVGVALSRAGLAGRLGQGAAGSRALLCAGSIGRACDSGMFTPLQLEYMRASRESCDARDVSWHRAVTRLVDTHGPDRVRNNAIMHALEDMDDLEGAAPLNETARKGRGRGRRRG